MSAKKKLKTKRNEPGFDGAKTAQVNVRISVSRSDWRVVRAMPGTFEWRYGRQSGNVALYHAGSHYAVLWERAGTAAAKSPDLGSAGGGGGWIGMPDGRLAAMDDLSQAMRELGKRVSARLTDYCVHGLTTKAIARKYDVPERDMAPILHQDLRDCAYQFKFL
ncbi:hypothetical protein [Phyllobacterium sp. OV277]|uniref:hypothetical protein n=1 Tax=Phyllobacterium sp. OV277 TaxID=1882772 RepID=UPI00087FE0C6|nr:hypothetical protein [Phyllobacterium sp. OV277]SDP08962.1 hypothetical protein SAMN05443582_103372 [Phyllobacterium sp. OV277]